MWVNFFDKIYLINLPYRTDRLSVSSQILNDFEIPFERYEAIEDAAQPCVGLVRTMQAIFKHALREGYKNVLIFEDDIEMLVDSGTFNEVMNGCVSQLPRYYHIFYLGCNHPAKFVSKYSENLLPVKQAYSTHAVAYNKSAMQFIVNRAINEPIDNFLVREFQPHSQCYCAFPMLVSQRVDYSDIGKNVTNWKKNLEVRFAETTKHLA